MTKGTLQCIKDILTRIYSIRRLKAEFNEAELLMNDFNSATKPKERRN